VPSLNSYSYAYGPILVLLVLGVLVLLLRWAFSRGGSLVEKRSRSGAPTEYGMLEPVDSPATYIEAEIQRRRLDETGIKATIAMTNDGPRVMVFPEDAKTARAILRAAADQDPGNA
jgi:hypothetical protein